MGKIEPLFGMEYAQEDGLPKFGTDALLLADFCPPAENAADLGCGQGIIALLLSRSCGRVTGIELDPAAAAVAAGNAARNGLEGRVHIVCGDLRDPACLPPPGSLELIACNPPYFAPAAGAVSPDPARAAARTEGECTLPDVLRAARRCLAFRGRLCFLWRPERLTEAAAAAEAEGFALKRLRAVHQRADRPAMLLLCEARKGARPGLCIEPPLILQESDGSPTAEYRRIYQI